MIEFNVYLMIWNMSGTLKREEILSLLNSGIEEQFEAVFQNGSGVFTLFKSKKYFESLHECMDHGLLYRNADEEISKITDFIPYNFKEKVKSSEIEARIMIEPIVDSTQFDFYILNNLSAFSVAHNLPIYVMSNDF